MKAGIGKFRLTEQVSVFPYTGLRNCFFYQDKVDHLERYAALSHLIIESGITAGERDVFIFAVTGGQYVKLMAVDQCVITLVGDKATEVLAFFE
ncbi:MAG: hypothetical protein V4594_13115 [Bacteroidota bacterium]